MQIYGLKQIIEDDLNVSELVAKRPKGFRGILSPCPIWAVTLVTGGKLLHK